MSNSFLGNRRFLAALEIGDAVTKIERDVAGSMKFSDALAGITALSLLKAPANTEAITMGVDPSGGTSPPDGTLVTSQAEYDALGYSLKYADDVFRILPPFLAFNVTVNLVAGTYLVPAGRTRMMQWPRPMCWPGALAKPSVTFQNTTNWTQIEAAQAGTRQYWRITRTSGTWTAHEHRGRFMRVVSGPGAGSLYPIGDNTTTYLELAGPRVPSPQSITFDIVEPAVVWLPTQDGSTPLADLDAILEMDDDDVLLYLKGIRIGDPGEYAPLKINDFVVRSGLVALDLCMIHADTVGIGGDSYGTAAPKDYSPFMNLQRCLVYTYSSSLNVRHGGYIASKFTLHFCTGFVAACILCTEGGYIVLRDVWLVAINNGSTYAGTLLWIDYGGQCFVPSIGTARLVLDGTDITDVGGIGVFAGGPMNALNVQGYISPRNLGNVLYVEGGGNYQLLGGAAHEAANNVNGILADAGAQIAVYGGLVSNLALSGYLFYVDGDQFGGADVTGTGDELRGGGNSKIYLV